jgi:hypothetical protein
MSKQEVVEWVKAYAREAGKDVVDVSSMPAAITGVDLASGPDSFKVQVQMRGVNGGWITIDEARMSLGVDGFYRMHDTEYGRHTALMAELAAIEREFMLEPDGAAQIDEWYRALEANMSTRADAIIDSIVDELRVTPAAPQKIVDHYPHVCNNNRKARRASRSRVVEPDNHKAPWPGRRKS